MERVPTQTDLVRVCDAADEIVQHYRWRIAKQGSTVKAWEWDLEQFENVIRLLPYPRHYFTPFASCNVDWWERREHWQSWTDEAYESFVNLSCLVRNLHLHWIDVKGDALPNQQLKASDQNVAKAIESIAEDSARLREAIKNPMPFRLRPERDTQSLYRDGKDYRDNVAKLGKWFPIIEAICRNGGFLNHKKTAAEFKAAGFNGNYESSFKTGVSRRLNIDLLVLDIELINDGERWALASTREELP